MLFNSIEFVLYLLMVFVLYWFVFKTSLKAQNALLFVVSYVFYGWWDYRFLSLILLTTILDYFLSLKIHRTKAKNVRKLWLFLSLGTNLGILFFFKYFSFFAASLAEAFEEVGYDVDLFTLNVILPVGISFYTFQTMSYTVDVYKRRFTPTTDFIAFAAFISFFPQLVAGPIERASNLLPQMLRKRVFNVEQAVNGLRLMLWGFFKKIVIADSLAPIVNEVFGNHTAYPGGTLLIASVYFSFQIYCDFSGYSDIARGLAKLFGFELMINFNFPYLSRNIGEFWRRWHISLSTWFRDYLYIPLGGSRVGASKAIRNIFIVFLVSGLWHGANWTFIIWGLIHALLFIPSFFMGTNRQYVGDFRLPVSVWAATKTSFQIVGTFVLVTVAWIFFRAPSVQVATEILQAIGTDMFSFQNVINPYRNQPVLLENIILALFVCIELMSYLGFKEGYRLSAPLNVCIDVALTSSIILFSPVSSDLAFIYFQF